ncbi:MAG: hypothetical protein AB7P22_16075 [Vicinamibacterales bacterium]
MTLGKATTVAVGFVAAMAIGVWVGPYITDRDSVVTEPLAGTAVSSTESDKPAITPEAAPARRSARRVDEPVDTIAAVSVSAPELHARHKPILNRGANVAIASEEFQDATQFAAVAHAARNTGIPFMVLKHRVLNEEMSLADAIRASKTEINAEIEADLAVAAARSDLATLAPAQ